MSTSTDTVTHPRVASLLPAATEIVCALGYGGQLVGVSHECDFPPGVEKKPVMTRSKVIQRESSGAIDRDVRQVLRDALGVYDLELEALRSAAPDVIVTQDLCDVCAVSFEEVQRAANELLPGAKLVNLAPTRLDDLWKNLRQVAEAFGVPERAEGLIDQLASRLADISHRAKHLARRPHVLSIEWIDPVMIGGMWMPELIEIVGGRPLVTHAGDHAPTLTHEELRALDPAPDVVLIKPCGFSLERSLMELETLRDLIEEMPWPAKNDGDVFLADGNAYFNRPGPRLVESAELLAAVVHPFDFMDFGAKHADSFVRVARR
ncbi:MAG TPA: ABC transporter substrate-binding protein [Planctomycetota bacterium]|nr:ABC transporter substrate-binding protein [Planctomycetota bacterium]